MQRIDVTVSLGQSHQCNRSTLGTSAETARTLDIVRAGLDVLGTGNE
jgi:hypothetical protein